MKKTPQNPNKPSLCPACRGTGVSNTKAAAPVVLEEMLSLSEVGRLIGLKDWKDVRSLAEADKLPGAVKFDTGRIRVPRSAVQAYLAASSRPVGRPQ
ncbi:MAG: hypothetical protein ACH37Z_14970 [Anaerolineae bacterium]